MIIMREWLFTVRILGRSIRIRRIRVRRKL